jgi:hypothetical protein
VKYMNVISAMSFRVDEKLLKEVIPVWLRSDL